jgi:hypothetical protein
MKELAELVEIISRHHKNLEDAEPGPAFPEDGFVRAFEGLRSGNIRTEEDLAKLTGNALHTNGYRVFKSRFKDRVVRRLFFIEFSKHEISDYGRALVSCSRSQHAIRLLLHLHARKAAIDICLSTLKKAMQFEFFDIALYCTRRLRSHYGQRGDSGQYDRYNEMLYDIFRKLHAELQMEECLGLLYSRYANVHALQPGELMSVENLLKSAAAVHGKYCTYQTGLHFFRIRSNVEQLRHNYKEVLIACDDFEAHLEQYKNFEHETRMAELSLLRLGCCLHMRNYAQGNQYAALCEDWFKKSSNNWFVYQEQLLLLAMHSAKYKDAGDIIREVKTDSHFSRQQENRKEIWKLYEAYYYLLAKSGMVPGEKHVFKMGKLLTDTPIYSKDKKGYNVAIFIVQLMSPLISREYKALDKKIEDLKTYMALHLSGESNYMYKTFLEMIIAAKDCNYKTEKVKAATVDLSKKLWTAQNSEITSQDGLEIVPYTVLWDIALGRMK